MAAFSGSPRSASARRFAAGLRRRALAAFLTGAAISVVGLAALASNLAGAHGPFGGWNSGYYSSSTDYSADSEYAPVQLRMRLRWSDFEEPRRRHRRIAVHKVKAVTSGAPGAAVCVRLCDGAFFPLPSAYGDADSQATTCGSLCPDAPTEVFYRNSSDRIEDAISAKGERYSALPVALRFQKTSDATCSCHRDVVAYAPLSDATLRRGDALMTPAGIVVFRGAEGASHRPADFTALANVSMPWPKRSDLQAIERVSLATDRPSLANWMASQNAPALTLRTAKAARSARADDSKFRFLVWRGQRED